METLKYIVHRKIKSPSVLVVGYSTQMLYEFTTHGQLLKTITLPSDAGHPTFAVQLSWTHGCFYAVSFHSPLRDDCCVVDDNGNIVKAFRKSSGPSSVQLKCPYGMAVDSRNMVFLADCWNNRIVVLNSEKLDSGVSSDSVSENDVSRMLPVSVDGGLLYPKRLCLDESRDRLYIRDDHNRLIVVNSLNDMTNGLLIYK